MKGLASPKSIKPVQSHLLLPTSKTDMVSYADLMMGMPTNEILPPHYGRLKSDLDVPYADLCHPLPENFCLQSLQKPSLPCKVYQSADTAQQQTNDVDLSDTSCPLPRKEDEIQPPPIPPRTYKEIKPAFQALNSIDDEITRLDEEYIAIENLVLETIRQQNVPVKKMLQWVLVLPMMLKAQFSEVLQAQRKEMSAASDVDELFLILSQYWNSLQPSLLEHLIIKLCDATLRDHMNSYRRDLENFRKHTTLGEFVDKWMGIIPSGLDEFIVELGKEWRGKTIHDLEQFRLQLSRQKCFNGHMPFTKKVISGSILVVFAIPRSVFPLNFVGKEMWYFLLNHQILRVMVEGRCVLDLVCWSFRYDLKWNTDYIVLFMRFVC